LAIEVRVEVSVVSAIAASGGRSFSKRLSSSAAKCCESAAEPPLPQAMTLPPAARLGPCARAAASIGAAMAASAASLTWALSCEVLLDALRD
jgi:hypothetical protein